MRILNTTCFTAANFALAINYKQFEINKET